MATMSYATANAVLSDLTTIKIVPLLQIFMWPDHSAKPAAKN